MAPTLDSADLAALARRALEQGRLAEAADAVETLLARQPEDGTAWIIRGVLDLQRGTPAAASEAFARAERLGADRRRARLGAGMAALELGESERAWATFETVAREHGDDAETMHWLLCAGTALGRWSALAERLEAFVARNPDEHAVRFALGAVCLRLGARERAREHCQTLRRLHPDFDGIDDLERALAA